MKNNTGSVGSPERLTPPAHLFTGRQVLEKVRKSLEEERGYKMTLERLAAVIGTELSTAGYRFNVGEQEQILAFIAVLERLSDPVRTRLLSELLRPLPLLLHPRLAHSPGAVGDLLKILSKSRGLTVVSGGTDASRTFVLTALGHTFPQIDPRHRMAAGLDTHQPTNFVPCESVIYLRNPISRERARQVIHEVWPQILASDAPLLLLNDIWSLVAELREAILVLAKTKHVVVADAIGPDLNQAARKKASPVHILTLSDYREHPWFIRISCQSPRVRRRKNPRR